METHELKKVDYHQRKKKYVAICTCWHKEYFVKSDYPRIDLDTAAWCELAPHINAETETLLHG